MFTVEMGDHARVGLRRFTRAEYDRLVELGLFHDERVELLHGLLVEMGPQNLPHSFAVQQLTRQLIVALADRALVRVQLPFIAADDSEPEPDFAVVPLDDDGRKSQPSRAHLIIEVADSSHVKDRRVKGPLYAASGIPEYWLVLAEKGVVEIYRDPRDGQYQRMESVSKGASVSPAAFPDVTLSTADFLP